MSGINDLFDNVISMVDKYDNNDYLLYALAIVIGVGCYLLYLGFTK